MLKMIIILTLFGLGTYFVYWSQHRRWLAARADRKSNARKLYYLIDYDLDHGLAAEVERDYLGYLEGDQETDKFLSEEISKLSIFRPSWKRASADAALRGILPEWVMTEQHYDDLWEGDEVTDWEYFGKLIERAVDFREVTKDYRQSVADGRTQYDDVMHDYNSSR